VDLRQGSRVSSKDATVDLSCAFSNRARRGLVLVQEGNQLIPTGFERRNSFRSKGDSIDFERVFRTNSTNSIASRRTLKAYPSLITSKDQHLLSLKHLSLSAN
jgi:hypothetical protein